jgi:hypothetical protein
MSSIPFDTDSGCVVVFPLFAKPNPQTLLTNMPSLTKSSQLPGTCSVLNTKRQRFTRRVGF